MTSTSYMEAMEKALSEKRMIRDEAYATYAELEMECTMIERLIKAERNRPGMDSAAIEPRRDPPKGGSLAATEPSDHSEPLETAVSGGRLDGADQQELVGGLRIVEEQGPPKNESSAGYPLDLDLSGADTRMDKIRVLAMHLPDQTFRVGDASRWLIAIGASKTDVKNLNSAFYRHAKYRTDYRKIESGVFQYVGYGDAAKLIPFKAVASE